MVIDCVNSGVKNDDVSMLLPQAWRYNLVCTMSMTALQHFLALRTSREAHYDIMDLAYEIYEALPSEHVYLFKDFVKDYNNG
jgi:thymidylate synthase (FAD)